MIFRDTRYREMLVVGSDSRADNIYSGTELMMVEIDLKANA